MEDRRFLKIDHRQPPWRPAIQRLRYRQNVAGLWLKYGAKSLKIEASSQCGIVDRMRRFVDDNR
jgi:hypothetical protein